MQVGEKMENLHFWLNTPFKPSRSLIPWFTTYIALGVVFILCTFYFPIAFFNDAPFEVHVLILGGIAALVIIFLVWIRLYYESMWYELRADEMSWKRGVWFRTTGIVPFSRITNLDIRQGPVMRFLKISSLSIQTAGYSGQAEPEIRIEAIEYAEELRELIRMRVRFCYERGDGTGIGVSASVSTEKPTDLQILDELKKIRSLLEQKK
jgi:membrane protein YdbS with pleckstrin-like domain